ncbi:MAG: hypothetical protein R3F14_16345 [Polyangiaceae bacterium]
MFGLGAQSDYEQAIGDKGLCPTKTACYPEGKRLVDGASEKATVSTIGFIAGGVALAGGVVLFLTAPSEKAPAPAADTPETASITVVPVAGQGFGGLWATGSF